jgi:glycosyltransferase involved in cell wall biosynthesis
MIRNLLIVSTEDSRELKSWSNVPYLFCKNLENQGIHLHRVTLRENLFLRRLVSLAQKIFGLFGGVESTWSYSRSLIYFLSARKQIDNALQKHKVDAVLMLNFSYSPSLPAIVPVFMFCDWPYGYRVERQLGRTANKYEKKSIEREQNLLDAVDAVFPLFPLASQYMKTVLPKANVHYLGNVINAVQSPLETDIKRKMKSQSILFIGKPHYANGARHLLEAYKVLKPKYPRLSLDIIGMERGFLGEIPEGVICHGYLDKGDQIQCKKYYEILRTARIFVNTTPKWASFSATLEALYFYTPIITSSYPEILETLGQHLSCGAYYTETGNSLDLLIENFLADEGYESIAAVAHSKTKMFGWDRYVEKFLEIATNTGKIRVAFEQNIRG